MSFAAPEAPEAPTVQNRPPRAFWVVTGVALPLLNVPLVVACASLGGLEDGTLANAIPFIGVSPGAATAVVILAMLELMVIGGYVLHRGFAAGSAVLAGILSIVNSFALLIVAYVVVIFWALSTW